MKHLKKADRYVLHSQEQEGEHKLFKAEVDPSISKKGVSVRFVGLEHLTTVGPLGGSHKRKGWSVAIVLSEFVCADHLCLLFLFFFSSVFFLTSNDSR